MGKKLLITEILKITVQLISYLANQLTALIQRQVYLTNVLR